MLLEIVQEKVQKKSKKDMDRTEIFKILYQNVEKKIKLWTYAKIILEKMVIKK